MCLIFPLFNSCSAVLLLHCQGWTAHQRKAKRTVSFLKLLSADIVLLLSNIVKAKALLLLLKESKQPANKCLLVFWAEKNKWSVLQLKLCSSAENTEVKFANSSVMLLNQVPLSDRHQTGETARDDCHREQLLMLVHLTHPTTPPSLSPPHQQLVSQWPLSPPLGALPLGWGNL